MDIHYGDVLIKYGSILDATDNTIPHIISGHESTNCGYLQDGDIVIADTAEDETVGKTIELLNVSKRKVEAGLHTVPCRPLFPFASMYLGYYMNTPPLPQAAHSSDARYQGFVYQQREYFQN